MPDLIVWKVETKDQVSSSSSDNNVNEVQRFVKLVEVKGPNDS